MSHNIQDRNDLMETIASLTAEAVLLEARVQTLCAELAVVAERTRVIAASLHGLDRPGPHGGATPADAGGRCGQRSGRLVAHTDDRFPVRGLAARHR
ncbi:hypothetical protein L1I79_36390 [Strepomyces sp. STD 3.1]|nr:hypothetical protein [Streptomyces sp. STD 3.1]